MAYNLEEQEQIASLRAFWDKYGNFILTVVTVVLLAIAGWRGWGGYQSSQAGQAATLYEQVRAAVEAKDTARMKEASGTLFERFGGTVYGPMAALLVARTHHEAGDLKAAKAPLQWTIEKARDTEFQHLARVRLAGVLLDEKAYDEGLKLLPMESAGAFAGAYADRRGDLLQAQGRNEEARAAYKLALEKLEERSPLRRLVQVKIDALGGVGS